MVQVGFKSDKGMRRQNNEDSCFLIPSDDVYIVCDGVGGNNSGEIASRTAVSLIAEYIRENDIKKLENEDELKDYFLEAINVANKDIYNTARKYPENSGMATTLVLAYIRDHKAYVANIGDSRAYVKRGQQIIPVTIDHTYVNELLLNGIITDEEAQNHPNRHMITRALGGDLSVEPDFFRVEVEDDDVMILCTDGLYSEVPEDRMVSIIDNALNMSQAAHDLVSEANSMGGQDNITVICLKI